MCLFHDSAKILECDFNLFRNSNYFRIISYRGIISDRSFCKNCSQNSRILFPKIIAVEFQLTKKLSNLKLSTYDSSTELVTPIPNAK